MVRFANKSFLYRSIILSFHLLLIFFTDFHISSVSIRVVFYLNDCDVRHLGVIFDVTIVGFNDVRI